MPSPCLVACCDPFPAATLHGSQMHCTDKWKTLVKAAKRQWKQGRAETKQLSPQLKARVEALMAWLGEAAPGGAAQAQAQAGASGGEDEGSDAPRSGARGKKRKENCPWTFEEVGDGALAAAGTVWGSPAADRVLTRVGLLQGSCTAIAA